MDAASVINNIERTVLKDLAALTFSSQIYSLVMINSNRLEQSLDYVPRELACFTGFTHVIITNPSRFNPPISTHQIVKISF